MIFNQLGWLGCLGIVLVPVAWKRMPPGWGRSFVVGAVVTPLAITLVPGIFDLATRTTSSFPIKSLSAVPAFFVVAECLLGSRPARVVLGVLSVLGATEAAFLFRPQADPARTPGVETVLEELKSIEPPRTIIADPWTSYLIAAETNHYPVTVVGQHGHPLDVLGAARLEQIQTVFSSGCPSERAEQVLHFYGRPLVVIPPGASPLLQDYGAVRGGEVDARRRRHLEVLGGELLAPGIYAFPDSLNAWRPDLESRFAFDPPGVRVDDPLGVATVEFPPAASPGETMQVVLWWTRGAGARFHPVEAHLRLESRNFQPGFKPWRKLREELGASSAARIREVHQPFDGSWPETCWPAEGALADTVNWFLPQDLPQGLYTLQVRVLEQSLMARIHLRDVLSDADRWVGSPLGTVRVEPKRRN